MSVIYLFMSVFDRFMIENAHKTTENAYKTIENAQKRSGTVNGHERSETVNGHERSETVNGHDRQGTIESERSKSLKRIVENGHGTVTLIHQKRKKHCMILILKTLFLVDSKFSLCME
jgi:hypothetical protein